MLKVLYVYVYVLIDPRAILSSVTFYVSMRFRISHKQHLQLIIICTPFGESNIVRKIYRNFIASIEHKETRIYLVKLDMIDVDLLLSWIGCISIML